MIEDIEDDWRAKMTERWSRQGEETKGPFPNELLIPPTASLPIIPRSIIGGVCISEVIKRGLFW